MVIASSISNLKRELYIKQYLVYNIKITKTNQIKFSEIQI